MAASFAPSVASFADGEEDQEDATMDASFGNESEGVDASVDGEITADLLSPHPAGMGTSRETPRKRGRQSLKIAAVKAKAKAKVKAKKRLEEEEMLVKDGDMVYVECNDVAQITISAGGYGVLAPRGRSIKIRKLHINLNVSGSSSSSSSSSNDPYLRQGDVVQLLANGRALVSLPPSITLITSCPFCDCLPS